MAYAKDIAGRKFGKLTTVGMVGKYKRMAVWRCKCECGEYTEVVICNLTSGNTKSCGCLKGLGDD
jgi:hypothetical protein